MIATTNGSNNLVEQWKRLNGKFALLGRWTFLCLLNSIRWCFMMIFFFSYSCFSLRKHTKTVGGNTRVGGTKALSKCSRKYSRKSSFSHVGWQWDFIESRTMRVLIEIIAITIRKSEFSCTFSAGIKASNFNKHKTYVRRCWARVFVAVFCKHFFVVFREIQRIYAHDNIEKMLAFYSADGFDESAWFICTRELKKGSLKRQRRLRVESRDMKLFCQLPCFAFSSARWSCS